MLRVWLLIWHRGLTEENVLFYMWVYVCAYGRVSVYLLECVRSHCDPEIPSKLCHAVSGFYSFFSEEAENNWRYLQGNERRHLFCFYLSRFLLLFLVFFLTDFPLIASKCTLSLSLNLLYPPPFQHVSCSSLLLLLFILQWVAQLKASQY